MPAWIVTSSAVVGSSAIRSFGSQASAIAIITRCRIPPDSWCGYSLTRRSGAGMWTMSSSSTALALRVGARDASRWRRSDLADLAADRERRVERRHRLLEDERDLAAADLRAGADADSGEQVLAAEHRRCPSRSPSGAAAGAATSSSRSCRSPTRRRCRAPRAARARTRLVDRLGRAVVGLEADGEVPDLEQRAPLFACVLSSGPNHRVVRGRARRGGRRRAG